MRWVLFGVCVAAAIVLQTTIAPRVAILGARPDWIVVLVVSFALYLRGNDAYWACWVLGFAADLATIERFGVLTIGYGLIGMTIRGLRSALFLRHTTTHLVTTFLAALVLHGGLSVYRLTVYPHGDGDWGHAGIACVLTAVYAAVWAPPIQYLLSRVAPALDVGGYARPRRGAADSKTVRV